jgi:copper chaperone CopZ
MRVELLITGMVAVHARHAVYTALGGLPGVRSAEVELGRAVVTHDGTVTEPVMRDALAAVGFELATVRVLPRELPLA